MKLDWNKPLRTKDGDTVERLHVLRNATDRFRNVCVGTTPLGSQWSGNYSDDGIWMLSDYEGTYGNLENAP